MIVDLVLAGFEVFSYKEKFPSIGSGHGNNRGDGHGDGHDYEDTMNPYGPGSGSGWGNGTGSGLNNDAGGNEFCAGQGVGRCEDDTFLLPLDSLCWSPP